jgi:tripartite-type tricarboxylate transporter receptor subunit TctC
MDRRSFVLGSIAGLAGMPGLVTTTAAQSAYPGKPITLLCPFAAGGAGDMLTRAAADHVRTKRNVAAGVEYRPGAGATIAPAQIAKAAPDGATLGLYSISPFLTVPHLQKVPYDTLKDFTYISIYAYVPIALYVLAGSPLNNWSEVVKFAMDNPGKFRWGTSGVRGAAHIATEAAFRKENARTTFVPFSGGADAITAMLGGHIEAVVSADYGPQLAAGKVKLIVLTGSEKLASQPNLPTFKELDYPISTEAIYGLFGPANLPRDVVSYWDAATREMMATDAFKAVLKTASANPVYMNSADFTANVTQNYRKLGEAIQSLGFNIK